MGRGEGEAIFRYSLRLKLDERGGGSQPDSTCGLGESGTIGEWDIPLNCRQKSLRGNKEKK